MRFKEWELQRKKFSEMLTEPPLPVDGARNPTVIKAGLGGCPELPMGVRSMCTPTTSAFPTYKAKRLKKFR